MMWYSKVYYAMLYHMHYVWYDSCFVHNTLNSWLLKAKNGQHPEKSGTKINLVPLDAEFSAE